MLSRCCPLRIDPWPQHSRFPCFPAHSLQRHAIFVWGSQHMSKMGSNYLASWSVSFFTPCVWLSMFHAWEPTVLHQRQGKESCCASGFHGSLSVSTFKSCRLCASLFPGRSCSTRAPLTERKREKWSEERGRDASVLQRWWVWGGMLAGVCLRSTSLCYSMRCRGKVSEKALHVGSGCEAFHLETNAFPVQWAFAFSGICACVHVCLRKKRYIESKTEKACLCVCVHLQEAVNIDLDLTDIGWGSVSFDALIAFMGADAY